MNYDLIFFLDEIQRSSRTVGLLFDNLGGPTAYTLVWVLDAEVPGLIPSRIKSGYVLFEIDSCGL